MQPARKIIVIEDDVSIRQMYSYKLRSCGYSVSVAENGITGLEVTKEIKPDLILLDLMMPEMNGDEMLQKLRETSWGSHIKVIILTNISKSEAPHSLRLLNVDRYIVKAHSTPSQVMDTVQEILGKPGEKVV